MAHQFQSLGTCSPAEDMPYTMCHALAYALPLVTMVSGCDPRKYQTPVFQNSSSPQLNRLQADRLGKSVLHVDWQLLEF